jgi:hypothetical protein
MRPGTRSTARATAGVPDLRGDAASLGNIDEVQGQQAGGVVEGTFRSIVDIALMKTRAWREEDWFKHRLEHDARFLQRVEQARKRLRAGRGVKLEDVDTKEP